MRRSFATLLTLAVAAAIAHAEPPSPPGPKAPAKAPAPPPLPTPPRAPDSGPGSDATTYRAVTTLSVDNPAFDASPVTVVGPVGDKLPERLPVVLFAHGFGAQSTARYWLWLEHMAKQGAWVVFPIYPPLPRLNDPSRYEVLWAGLGAAIKALQSQDGPRPDVTRIGFVGHSFGGGAAPAMAARAAARGWGSAAMWIECYAPWYDLDACAWRLLPEHAMLLSVGFEDDAVCDPATAAGFVKKAVTLADDRKRFVFFHTDARGDPRLVADHLAPLAYPPDAFDRFGTWRLDDALRTLAITGSKDARKQVFGTGPEATSLGQWSDGTPVAPLTFAWPLEEPMPKKVARMWTEGTPMEAAMRAMLSKECCCVRPLPPPEEAIASRLPPSERVVRAAPRDGWPSEWVAAFEKAPLLVVLHREGSQASKKALAAIDEAGRLLDERHVQVLKIAAPPIFPLGERLRVDDFPSVILFAKGGDLLLWREGDEPNLVPAILDLTKSP